MKREVGAALEVEITGATTLEFQIAVAPHPGTSIVEALSFVLNGSPITALEISGVHGNRIHKLDVPVGTLKVSYEATIIGRTDPAPVTEYDQSMYLRPSRYAEADKFYGFAATEFGNYLDSADLLEKVSLWVGTRLNYVPGSSDPIDGAVDTLLAGAGVCRDFAHLVVALLRAVNVPARVVSVYAPGLYPMDFHAVAEAFVNGQWRVVDGTLLGATTDTRADCHWSRCGGHRVLGQPQGCHHARRAGGHGDRGRRPAQGLDRPTGVDRLSWLQPVHLPGHRCLLDEAGPLRRVVLSLVPGFTHVLGERGCPQPCDDPAQEARRRQPAGSDGDHHCTCTEVVVCGGVMTRAWSAIWRCTSRRTSPFVSPRVYVVLMGGSPFARPLRARLNRLDVLV